MIKKFDEFNSNEANNSDESFMNDINENFLGWVRQQTGAQFRSWQKLSKAIAKLEPYIDRLARDVDEFRGANRSATKEMFISYLDSAFDALKNKLESGITESNSAKLNERKRDDG